MLVKRGVLDLDDFKLVPLCIDPNFLSTSAVPL